MFRSCTFIRRSCTSLQQNLFIRMEKNALLHSRRYPVSLLLSVRTDRLDRFFPPFFLFTHDDPSSRDRKRIDRLVGYLLKIGSLLFPHRRSSHEHPRSIKSPPANGTRVDMDQEGREEFLFFFKKRYRFKNTTDRFLLSFFPSSLRIPFILLKVRVTFAPRCGGRGETSRVQLER